MSIDIISGRPPIANKGVITEGGTPIGYEQVTISNTAIGLTVPPDANTATMVVESASVRFRSDGTDPTASVGMPIFQNQSLQIQNETQLTQFKAIRTGSVDAKLNVHYYRRS